MNLKQVLVKTFGVFFACALLVHVFLAKAVFPPSKGITYSFSDGRLGDHLISYMHAKWLSYKYHIPLIYRPFPLANLLQIEEREPYFLYSNMGKIECRRKGSTQPIEFEKKRVARSEKSITKKGHSTLFVLPYFPENDVEQVRGDLLTKKKWPQVKVEWDDPKFKQELRRCILPKETVNEIPLPGDCNTVALHVRRPSGRDTSEIEKDLFLKMPPLSFYIKGLKHLYKQLGEKQLYTFLFTDDCNPEALAREIKRGVTGCKIEVDFRREMVNPIEDFFNITRFDFLIRGMSNFSIAASKIANFRVEIEPKGLEEFTTIERER